MLHRGGYRYVDSTCFSHGTTGSWIELSYNILHTKHGPLDEYRLPYEKELGIHPTVKELKDFTLQGRPAINPQWRTIPGMKSLCQTMEECWDQDEGARLSACCVLERIEVLRVSADPSSMAETLV